jgi:hypothetical protein
MVKYHAIKVCQICINEREALLILVRFFALLVGGF